MSTTFSKPAADEYEPYYDIYIGLVPDGDILEILEEQLRDTVSLIREMPEETGNRAYAEGKWTAKELLGHVIDTERIFAYRGLCFARGDQTQLPGFEQDDYVSLGEFNSRSCKDLADEFEYLRKSNLVLFRSWTEEVQSRRGHGGGYVMAARAVPFVLAGHERHHMNVLRERYL